MGLQSTSQLMAQDDQEWKRRIRGIGALTPSALMCDWTVDTYLTNNGQGKTLWTTGRERQ